MTFTSRAAASPPDAAAASAADGDERPSKTRRKQQMTALQTLGTRLVALNAGQLAALPLTDGLREAILAAQRITAHEARRRQLQYIGKLMRQVEPEPIAAALDDLSGESRAAVALMHRCEQWRDRLLADDAALTALLDACPHADPQPLRALIRAARREHDAGQPPKQARALYRWLHQTLRTAPAADGTAAADAEGSPE